ncbi:MAG: LPS export ABC transporter periplasmic protein LptC [Gallionellaceae bacterium]|jgi:lipopolysaccharide export system protein LptC
MIPGLSLLERLRAWLPILPPLLLLAGTYWLNQQVQPMPVKGDTTKNHEIDFTVDNLSTVALDNNGQARYMMATEKMWHYQDDDTTYMQMPRFVSLLPGRAPLVSWANTGKITSHGDEVFLYNEVKIMRLGDLEREPLEFNTEYLHLVPDQDVADTDRPVTLTSARDTIHAVGMTIDNKTGMINLLANVRAIHEPPPK